MTWRRKRYGSVTVESSGYQLLKIEPGHYMGEFGLLDIYFTCTNTFGEEWTAYIFDENIEVVIDGGVFPTLRQAVSWAKKNFLPEPSDEMLEELGDFYDRLRQRLEESTKDEIDQSINERLQRA